MYLSTQIELASNRATVEPEEAPVKASLTFLARSLRALSVRLGGFRLLPLNQGSK